MSAPTPEEIRQAAQDIATEILQETRFTDVLDHHFTYQWPNAALCQVHDLITTRLRVEIEELHDE